MKKKWKSFDITYQEDRFIKEILEDEEYKFVFNYPVVVDIGANIGTFSFYIYDYAQKIYAVELAEDNINELKQTIEDNNLTKIIPINLAISGKSGAVNVRKDGKASYGGWAIDPQGGMVVESRSVHDFLNENGIEHVDLMKIDVEGAEFDIISAPDFPSSKISVIMGEQHFETHDDFARRFDKLGYSYQDLPSKHFLARRK